MMDFERIRREAFIAPPMRAYLEHLRDSCGFRPKVVYDIGASVMHFADLATDVWPGTRVIMFEAIDDVLPYYQRSKYDFHVGVLTDRDGRQVDFYQSDVHPSGSSYYREIGSREAHIHFTKETAVPKVGMTLATIVTQHGFPPPDLIKVDVQGSEMDIIRGGEDIFRKAKHLIVEMQFTEYNEGAPRVDTTLPYIESLGFDCVAPRLASSEVDADYGFQRRV